MPYNELRKDYILDRWVVIAKERSKRPTDLAKARPETAKSATCPLCVGNEHMTPPAVLLLQGVNGEVKHGHDPPEGQRPTNWLVRTIPNMYPAFTHPQHPEDALKIFSTADFGYAIGIHEVVVESPIHEEDPADASLPQLELVIEAYIDRFKALAAKSYVKYISIFRNYGLEAGASLSHAHSQIIATPMIPTMIKEEKQASDAYQKAQGRCVFCDIIEREVKTQRLIMQNEDFAVIAPYASINPMEFWILPKRHAPNIAGLTPHEVKSLAATLKTSLKALKDLVNDPPYNYGIHQTIDEGYHWHLEVYPKLSTWAGFEKSTGGYINTVTPESAAEALKKVIKH
jgi:UDPglucose--hexose-1-phosphate uridylyltransferase